MLLMFLLFSFLAHRHNVPYNPWSQQDRLNALEEKKKKISVTWRKRIYNYLLCAFILRSGMGEGGGGMFCRSIEAAGDKTYSGYDML